MVIIAEKLQQKIAAKIVSKIAGEICGKNWANITVKKSRQKMRQKTRIMCGKHGQLCGIKQWKRVPYSILNQTGTIVCVFRKYDDGFYLPK